jgi:hypothetical protein
MKDNAFFPPNTTGTMQSHFTIRDHFAGLAMQGMLVNTHVSNINFKEIPKNAYIMADAMMMERTK